MSGKPGAVQFVRFYLNAATGSSLDGHVQAFDYLTAVPGVCLYDNLRSAVLERCGDAIRFNPTLHELAAWYRFQLRPVAVARGENLFLFGPGGAKGELHKRLLKMRPGGHVAAVETEDKMTDAEVVAKVSKYFGLNSPRVHQTSEKLF